MTKTVSITPSFKFFISSLIIQQGTCIESSILQGQISAVDPSTIPNTIVQGLML